MRPSQSLVIASLAAALLTPALASAGSPEECAPSYETDPLRMLRQASLDLLGRAPSFEELEAVRGAEDRRAAVDEAIALMLVSDEYLEVMRGYHRDLLWGSLDSSIARVFPGNRQLQLRNIDASQIWALNAGNFRLRYRGRNDLYCIDQEQTEFDQDGRPIPISTFAAPDCTDGTCRQEGWVMVAPYWDPQNPVKVCAYDAQDFEIGFDGQSCSDVRVVNGGCGCGANLNQCSTPATREVMRAALAEEPSRIFAQFIASGASYLEAFRSDLTMMNGPVAHYYKWMRADATTNTSDIAFEADMGEQLDAPYTMAEWSPVTRGSAHAGAFTTVGYQMRFASFRARANRFYTAFYCDPFVPSVDGLPPEGDDPSPNLREREGCAGCHEVLEPAAAHFARWRINSAFGYLDDNLLDLELLNESCVCGEGTERNCNNYCNKYYVTADNSEPETFDMYGGLPLTSAYASPLEIDNANLGPAALVDEPAEQFAVAQCAVRTMAEHLLHRPLETTELSWLDEQTAEFIDSDYDFTTMVARLVDDERYRQTH